MDKVEKSVVRLGGRLRIFAKFEALPGQLEERMASPIAVGFLDVGPIGLVGKAFLHVV